LSYAEGSHFISLALHIPLEFLPRKKVTNPPLYDSRAGKVWFKKRRLRSTVLSRIKILFLST